MDGHYSMKSDVYSFGVLAIEIISGQKNWGFHHPDHEHNLLGHVSRAFTPEVLFHFCLLGSPLEKCSIKLDVDLILNLFRHGHCGMRDALWN